MKIKVMAVAEKRANERPNFQFVDGHGNGGVCLPSLRFLQDNPSFTVSPGEELLVGDFIPDFITGKITPILVPESIQKISAGKN